MNKFCLVPIGSESGESQRSVVYTLLNGPLLTRGGLKGELHSSGTPRTHCRRVLAKIRNCQNQLSVSDAFFNVKLRNRNIFNHRTQKTHSNSLLINTSLPLLHSDSLNNSLEPFERLIRIIPLPYKGLFDHVKGIIRIVD